MAFDSLGTGLGEGREMQGGKSPLTRSGIIKAIKSNLAWR